MKTNKLSAFFSLAAIVSCLAASGAKGSVILTTAAGDGMIGRDWWSNPNYYWVDSGGNSVEAYHDGGNRWWYRGLVIINVSSLAGTTLDPNSADFVFYSNGFSGVSLQYVSNIGSSLTTGYGQIAGTNIAALDGTTGWRSYDVTSMLQSSINAGAQNVGFVFNATTNYGGGSAASLESGKGAYIEVVPEPMLGSLLACGGLALLCIRRRSA